MAQASIWKRAPRGATVANEMPVAEGPGSGKNSLRSLALFSHSSTVPPATYQVFSFTTSV